MAPIAVTPPPALTADYVDTKAANCANSLKNGHGLETGYKIPDLPIGHRRPIRVVCLGAGYSGLMMAIMFNEKMKDANAELVIYERNEDLGGTWLENRYPYVCTRKT
jgi:hypothetical protein